MASAKLGLSDKPKNNVYFVDTKSTCFLCLEKVPVVIDLDDEEDDPPDSPQEINTNLNGSGVDKKANDDKGKFNFKAIHKFLKLEPGQLLASKVFGSSNSSSQLVNTDLSVVLCDNCKGISKLLNNLCVEFELLKLKLNSQLMKFLQVLNNSLAIPEKMDKFRFSMQNPMELLQVAVAELMRDQTKMKCKLAQLYK